MEIQSAYPRLQLPPSSSSVPSSPSFRQGEYLDVVVESRLADRGFLLKVLSSGQSLTAESPVDLAPGSRLRLQVTQTGEAGAIPKLRIVETEAGRGGDAAVTQDARRQYLPRQEPVLNLTRTLAQGSHQALPAPIRAAIQQILTTVPERASLTTADGLQRAVQNAGVFLEARLAQSTGLNTINQDTKAQLLKLAAALDAAGASQPGPVAVTLQATMPPSGLKLMGSRRRNMATDIPQEPDVQTGEASLKGTLQAQQPDLDQLARKVEGALARVVMDQLASLPNPDESTRVLQLAIPFHDGAHQDAAQLVVSREPAGHNREAGQDDYWAIDLELEPPGLGRFCGRLVWNRGKLETYLWSDVAATTERIAAHTDVLEARYRQAGLESSHLTTLRTGFRRPSQKTDAQASSPLLDISI